MRPSKNTPKRVDMLTLVAEKPKRRVRQPECRCPYCSADGGNKTIGPNGRPQHICHFPDCGRVFSAPKNLNRHLISHTDKKFICAECGKKFVRKDSLRAHIMIHMTNKQNMGTGTKEKTKKVKQLENKRLHVCHVPNCGKAYVVRANLKYHLLSHSDEKKFFCAHCNKGYARKDTLRRHITIAHTTDDRKWARCRCPNCCVDGGIRGPNGKLQHVCHFIDCGKVYGNCTQLKRHLETHRREMYIGPNCDKELTSQDSFDSHNEVKRKESNAKLKRVCNVSECGKVFNSFTSLKSHLECHNKKNDNEGLIYKSKLRGKGKRNIDFKLDEPQDMNSIDDKMMENGLAAPASWQISIQDSLECIKPQSACCIL